MNEFVGEPLYHKDRVFDGTARMTSIVQSSGVIVHRLRLAIRRRDRDTKRVREDGARFSAPGWTRRCHSHVTDRMRSIGQSSGVFVHRLRPAIRRRDRYTKRVHEDGARFSGPGWTKRCHSHLTARMTSIGQSSGVFVHRLRPAIRRRDRDTARVHEDGARLSAPGWTWRPG